MLKAKKQRDGWVACQIGARENYAVPRIFRSYDILQSLITDIWTPAYMQTFLSRFKVARQLLNRFHSDLGEVDVRHFSRKFAIREKLSLRTEKWEHLHRVNRLFAKSAGEEIIKIAARNKFKGFSHIATPRLRRSKWRKALDLQLS